MPALEQLPAYDGFTFPCRCAVCSIAIYDLVDGFKWHGYGNCAEVTDAVWEKWNKSKED
jgi:hypothetical protein